MIIMPRVILILIKFKMLNVPQLTYVPQIVQIVQLVAKLCELEGRSMEAPVQRCINNSSLADLANSAQNLQFYPQNLNNF